MRNYFSPLHGIRSPFGPQTSSLALYAANGLRPTFVLDPSRQKFFVDGLSTDLAGAVTHSRASGATYLDSSGVLQTAASGEIRDQAYAYVDGVLTGPYVLTEPESTNLIPDSGTIEQKDVHVTPQEYTLSFLSGNAFRSEINQTLADTAVDVFIYDTSKDSDGGAWRTGALAQASSWYNEPLNTATRGSRREFPAVAVIVAESNKVTIYDGDDPALPMWMVFNTGTGSVVAYGNAVNSVAALNGEILVGSATTGGLSRISLFEKPYQLLQGGSYYTIPARGLLVNRNGGVAWSAPVSDATKSLINGSVNDVAMTVLPDAPIDPATGLPVPTIAVATQGGVSVIKDDGTVVDITTTTTNFTKSQTVTFDGGNIRAAFEHGAAPNAIIITLPIPATDLSSTYPFNIAGLISTYLAGTTEDLDLDSALRGRRAFVSYDNTIASPSSATGTISPLCLVSERQDAPTKGMISYLSSTYNTGWMNGDIKGAFLVDTDDTDLVGSGELVTNGTFDTDTSGWTASGGTLSVVSGKLRLTSNSGTVYARQSFSVTSGLVYNLTVDVSNITAAKAQVWASSAGYTAADLALVDSLTTDQTVNVTFTATTGTVYLELLSNATTGQGADFDNISVKLADEDRSVNNKGLIVNGTITRSPVADGAELVAYSNFSTAANFLEQPYNGALDFGTGDFSIMVWLDRMEAWGSVLSRGMTGAVSFIIEGNGTENTMRISTGNTPRVRAMPWFNGVWRQLTFVRRSGVASLYLDGVQTDSWSAPENVSVPDAPLFVGKNTIFGSGFYPGKMALLRISATAPTPDQIAKIYEDEKVLFQENAACTLYGPSDAVTALAHDPDTDLLHVGTSAGRSVFDGLRRIDNTTDAVTTAISASGGMIAEQ